MASKKPRTIRELFAFYYEDFKPLYSHLQSLNEPPQELFFEVNATFDHLSRHWHYGQTEEEVVNAAAAHLKRGCFDAFKIVVRNAMDQYNELRRIDTSIIDNGAFDRGMRQLVSRIQAGAIRARQAEGDSRDEHAWHNAYELWEPVYVDCVRFQSEFYLNDKIEWARRKQTWRSWRLRLEGLTVGIAAGLVVWPITTLLSQGSGGNHRQTTAGGADGRGVAQPLLPATSRAGD